MMIHLFAKGLDDLAAYPDKAKINALFMMAEDASGDPVMISEVCNTLLGKLHSAEPSRKLSILYVLDIVSKKGGAQFQQAFAPHLLSSFMQVYSEVRILKFYIYPFDQAAIVLEKTISSLFLNFQCFLFELDNAVPLFLIIMIIL